MQIHSSALIPLCLALGAGLCATDADAQASRCRTSNCFNDGEIRTHEVINDETLVVYVGRQRCPYVVKVNQMSCDLTFLPDVEFIKNRGRNSNIGGNRVCTFDSGLALDPMGFGRRDVGRRDNVDPVTGQYFDCRVLELRAVTDDELIELYVSEGLVPPPPPIGNGQIGRAGDKDAATSSEAAGSTSGDAVPEDE